ncbi:MAG: methyltransferase domain-containing protein [Byssovorax sp.]
MQLYTGPISPNGKRVRICAAELGVSLELKLLDFSRAEQRSPAYLAHNPMGKVPTLTDGDFTLWESPAILAYLAQKQSESLWPRDPQANADLLRWMFFGASHLDPYFTTLVVERFIKARQGAPADEALCASAGQWLSRFLPVVEHQLAGRDFITGAFSLADIVLGTTIELSALLQIDLDPFPHIRAWIARLQARPSWAAASGPVVRPPGSPSRERFLDAYGAGSPPPWDIGRAQDDLVAVFDEIRIAGSALDLGCGTGENVLELARRGLDAWGIDAAPKAIEIAEKKRAERGLSATFKVGDALDLAGLGRTFDTVLDCGLFHVIDEEERRRYLRELAQVLRPGGRHLMLGFATNTTGAGPRGYSPEELRAYFADGFREVLLRPTSFNTVGTPSTSFSAWVSLFERV